MKNTIVMLAFIATLLLTWMSISFIGWAVSSDLSFRACTTHIGTIMTMLLVGWIPSIVVIMDIDEFNNNNKKW